MADHKPGSMDISAQEKTFESFIYIATRTVFGIIVFLVFLALVNG
jgi:hypothetical protein